MGLVALGLLSPCDRAAAHSANGSPRLELRPSLLLLPQTVESVRDLAPPLPPRPAQSPPNPPSWIDHVRFQLHGRVDLGQHPGGLHLDGAISVDDDFPVASAGLKLPWHGQIITLPLPSVQALPSYAGGNLGIELRIRLFDTHF